MAKVVYNGCYGGFNLSEEAVVLAKSYDPSRNWDDYYDIPRHDPTLVRVVEELGDEADSGRSNLCIKEIPSGTHYRIDEYDGWETVVTKDMDEWILAP